MLLQETKWTGGQEEILAQYLPGVTVRSAPSIYTELGNRLVVPRYWYLLVGKSERKLYLSLAKLLQSCSLTAVASSTLSLSIFTLIMSRKICASWSEHGPTLIK